GYGSYSMPPNTPLESYSTSPSPPTQIAVNSHENQSTGGENTDSDYLDVHFPISSFLDEDSSNAIDTTPLAEYVPPAQRKISTHKSVQNHLEATVKKDAKQAVEIKPDIFPSYPVLAALSLKLCPTGQLLVGDIYRHICEMYPFFNDKTRWESTVRHALSRTGKFEMVKGGVRDPRVTGKLCSHWRIKEAKMNVVNKAIQTCIEEGKISDEIIDRVNRISKLTGARQFRYGGKEAAAKRDMKAPSYNYSTTKTPEVRSGGFKRDHSSSDLSSSNVSLDHSYAVRAPYHSRPAKVS
ncbi:hypothetical protein PFISCL1PPCAC_28487, partial [Pristionchus fissidentatus]